MAVRRTLLKVVLLPISVILLLIKGLINLVIKLTSVVVGLFTLYIGVAVIYCLISQRWRDLIVFFTIGVTFIVLLFMIVMLTEFIGYLRERIKEI